MAAASATSAATSTSRSLNSAIRGSIISSLVFDAAGMPIHWIYQKEPLAEALKGIEAAPEFRAESACPFYRLPTGRQSGYGEQTLATLRHCAQLAREATAGAAVPAFDAERFSKTLLATFGPGTEFDPEATTVYHVDGKTSGRTKRYEAQTEKKWPINGSWVHHSVKFFLDSMAEGKEWPQGSTDDKQADGAARVAPVVGLHAGAILAAREAGDAAAVAAADAALAQALHESTRSLQNDDAAVSAANLIGRVVLEGLAGSQPRAAVAAAVAFLRSSDRPLPLDTDAALCDAAEAVVSDETVAREHQEVVDEMGCSCMLPHSVLTPLHAAARAEVQAAKTGSPIDIVAAARETMVASGCNCSRLSVLGAVLGAVAGAEALPAEWVAKTKAGKDIEEEAGRIAAVNVSS